MTFARFTRDMIETLLAFSQAYQRDGVVTLQVTDRGLWLVNPLDGSRQFLGQAPAPERERAGSPREAVSKARLH